MSEYFFTSLPLCIMISMLQLFFFYISFSPLQALLYGLTINTTQLGFFVRLPLYVLVRTSSTRTLLQLSPLSSNSLLL
ncbi:hypothetical protein DFH27DRAFT_530341 [Peziza echinospora]|nr:hypothetical protein DFH27DRAFT_530341 [Peziza echinospora]